MQVICCTCFSTGGAVSERGRCPLQHKKNPYTVYHFAFRVLCRNPNRNRVWNGTSFKITTKGVDAGGFIKLQQKMRCIYRGGHCAVGHAEFIPRLGVAD